MENTERWSVSLRFLQSHVNLSRHETRHGPSTGTFGRDQHVGLGTSIFATKILFCEIVTEEKLETCLIEDDTGTDTEIKWAITFRQIYIALENSLAAWLPLLF
ncbi:hypothetical protein PoB_000832800 [Plakobranchus ocellatus]|uniref:Uncharacterized protein n=1 Tax=Plakobranchus ocellatus TaxID=259542 RepID=A0AAV3YHE5_9GAST|nr:hypothetical protein PoB_000832800 [Plakobranchus ocellatus]